MSDHNMVYLAPTYVMKLKASKPTIRTTRSWNDEARDQLSGSLACTDWEVFFNDCNDLNTITSTVTDYINFCVDTLVPVKTCKFYPNNKPWVTSELR